MMSYGLGYANPHSSQIDAVYPRICCYLQQCALLQRQT